MTRLSPSLPHGLREQLAGKRAAAIQQFRDNRRPDVLLRRLSRAADQALRALLVEHPLPAGAALAAVGGYGRSELFPHSDVDILLLLRQPLDMPEAARVERFIAALWDIGLEPGHSVRNVEDCLRVAAADITVETALLETRWLAGNRALLQALHDGLHAQREPQAFFHAKLAEMRHRHARHEDTPYALEPNCKESPGGLRDLQLVLWLTRAAGHGGTWREVARHDLLTPAELRAIRRAESAFKRLRIELHLLTGRREDRLLFDLQPALAAVYGFAAGGGRRPSELLMQRYYWAARVSSLLSTLLIQSLAERVLAHDEAPVLRLDGDFDLRRGQLDVRRDDGFLRNPALLLRVFLVWQQSGAQELSARTLRAMWHARHLVDAHFRRNPVNRHAFLQILQAPSGVLRSLRRMNLLGLLPRYLPPFRRIVGQMQHDLFHAYTVDQHILMVLRNLRRYTQPEYAEEYPLAHRLMQGFERPWLLYIAALYHDIAKGRGGDHSVLGARDALRFCQVHGLSEDDTDLVVFLVREHLRLSIVAQKQDLSDPEVLRTFIEVVGTPLRLTALFLLTVADIRGTSPKVWNSWKGKLLESLYWAAQTAMSSTAAVAGQPVLAQRRQAAADEIRRLGLRDDSRDRLWREFDDDYFLRFEAEDIAWHARHLHSHARSDAPVVRARVIGQGEALQVLVYSRDHPALFVTLCRYFDQRALSVQEARIYTTRHERALDSFVLLLPAHEHDYRSHASLIEHELQARLTAGPDAGSTEPSPVLLRQHSRQARVFPLAPRTVLRAVPSVGGWELSVETTDRPGLLLALARVFAMSGVRLRMAKVLTLGERVEDSFLIEGGALESQAGRQTFEAAILAALAPGIQ